MARGDVADLVAEHAGQLGLVVQIREKAARHIDVSAGQRERVDRGAVDDGERPRQVGAMRVARELLADLVDVALQVRIVVDAHLPADLGVLLLADRELLGLAEERHLLLAGDRVRRARRGDRDEKSCQEKTLRAVCAVCGPLLMPPTCATPVPANSGRFSRAPTSRSTGS